ncbi:MAG: amidohydrolase family protein [Phycisphaeraceae bacterium]|nr:amidohydrolase family protein [Phycisphaeraceae bacterium]
MIILGQLALPLPDRSELSLSPGWLRLEGGAIAELGLGDCPASPDLGSPEHLIFPGFIDAHVHLPQFDSVGADGLELLEWLSRVIFPAEVRWADPDYAAAMTDRVCRRLVSHGTTGVAAYATVHHQGALAAAAVIRDHRLRALVGQVLMDQQAPTELLRPAVQLLAEAEAFADRIAGESGGGRLEAAVTPRFAVSCSPDLLAGSGEIARRRRLAVQTHLSETRSECDLVRTLHDSVHYTAVYEKAGLLNPRTILGHAVWLNNDERAILARSGSIVAHCPGANLFLGSGAMSLDDHRRGSVRLALGSDIAGGPDISMVRVARGMIETAKRSGSEVPAGAQMWWLITAGNADALGWSDTGRLAVGSAADIVLVRPRGLPPRWLDRDATGVDPLSMLLYAWDDRWIEHTIVAGRVSYSTELVSRAR